MLKIAIISPNYPTEDSSSFAFVHVRAKLYQKTGAIVRVFLIGEMEIDYKYEGIKVVKNKRTDLRKSILDFQPDVIAIHYPTYKTIPLVNSLPYPTVAWVHGHEVLWNIQLSSAKSVINYIVKRLVLFPRELYQKTIIRNFLRKTYKNVFVSKWLLEKAQLHTLTRYDNSIIIPNPVDCKLFTYKEPINITKAIALRGLDSKKYGVDIGIKAFSKQTDSHLTIVGRGKYKKKYNILIKRIRSNSMILDRSIPHNKLPEYFRKFGFFVAPSRIEAQGLAMCEAMACGLPVIATKVGGIPEFVRNRIDGILVKSNDPKALAAAIKELLYDESDFIRMSQNARKNMENVCSSEKVISIELEILKNSLNNNNA
ncbi:MAG: glycosyltransferase [Planctomycetia bacterium]|nr:glycosyltransferase [Planctomycetia bacterium]